MPIVPHNQPTPVVQPAMSTLHLPATRADRVHLRRTAGTLASRPMMLRNRGKNPSSSQFPPELCAVVALVSSQRVRSLLGPASSTRDANPVHHIQSHCHLGYADTGHTEGQRQSLSLHHHVDRAPLTLPSVVNAPPWLGRNFNPGTPSSSPACPVQVSFLPKQKLEAVGMVRLIVVWDAPPPPPPRNTSATMRMVCRTLGFFGKPVLPMLREPSTMAA